MPVLALRVSYVGELGWEIYAPTEFGAQLWDTLWAAGRAARRRRRAAAAPSTRCGWRRATGCGAPDIHAEYDPYEAGLGFAVALDKGDFIGREALARVKERGRARAGCAA